MTIVIFCILVIQSVIIFLLQRRIGVMEQQIEWSFVLQQKFNDSILNTIKKVVDYAPNS